MTFSPGLLLYVLGIALVLAGHVVVGAIVAAGVVIVMLLAAEASL